MTYITFYTFTKNKFTRQIYEKNNRFYYLGVFFYHFLSNKSKTVSLPKQHDQ